MAKVTVSWLREDCAHGPLACVGVSLVPSCHDCPSPKQLLASRFLGTTLPSSLAWCFLNTRQRADLLACRPQCSWPWMAGAVHVALFQMRKLRPEGVYLAELG